MSYDFSIDIDTGGSEPHSIEPYFDDVHPALSNDGFAGNALLTTTGYARCGNYTSNVSGMWTRCLTAALESVPEARKWIGDDDRRMREENEFQRDREIETSRLCLRDLAGKPCGEIAPLLAAAVKWGVENIIELHERDPDNGWGNGRRCCDLSVGHPAGLRAASARPTVHLLMTTSRTLTEHAQPRNPEPLPSGICDRCGRREVELHGLCSGCFEFMADLDGEEQHE